MKEKIIILFSIFFIGCSSNFNTPFINVEETTQLSFGLTQDQVLQKIGKPLFVAEGGNNSIVWVYEVRTELVASNKLASGDIIPNKYHDTKKHGDPIHKLALTFNKGKLSGWNKFDN